MSLTCKKCLKTYKKRSWYDKHVKACIKDEISTFEDLYNFLRTDVNLLEWLNEEWNGKNKQESLLRLFSGLKLISKLKDFDICKGNFNLKTFEPLVNFKDVFVSNGKKIKLKDSGDSSDLTGLNGNKLLALTSKNYKKYNIGDLDIEKINNNFKDLKDY